MKGRESAWKEFSLGGKAYRTRKERSAQRVRGAILWSARIEQRVGEDWRPYAIGRWTGELIKDARMDGQSRASQPAAGVVSAAEVLLIDRYVTAPRRRLEFAGASLTPERLESLSAAARALQATRQRVMVRVLDALGDEDPERALGALGRELRARRAG